MRLVLLISKVRTAARELKNKLFHEALEKEYGSKATLNKHNNLIFEAEHERNELEIELSDLKGLARLF